MQDYRQLLRDHILDNPTFASATFSGRQRGAILHWQRLTIRPVEIKGRLHLQFSYFDETQNITQNYADAEAAAQVDEALDLPFRHFNVQTLDENTQVNLSKRGKPAVHRTSANTPDEIDLAHDRQKNTILSEGEDIPFLKAIGMMTRDGQIKANMRSKFRQINAFLQLLAEIDEIADLPDPIRLVDFGCGKAYLTFAAYHYLHEMLGRQVEITGVDVKKDVIQKNIEVTRRLGWRSLKFEHGRIEDYHTDSSPDIVVALHACDTASDDAIAQGIRWRSRIILAAPCCHHDLQAQLSQQSTPEVFEPVLRYGLLHERMGDILTDTFRALILRIMGYRVDVTEFVAPDHTPKNLLIRAVLTGDQSHVPSVEEYARLQNYWQVTPYLQRLLQAELQSIEVD